MELSRFPGLLMLSATVLLGISGCKKPSADVPTNEIVVSALVFEEMHEGEPAYQVIKGLSHGPNVRNYGFVDIRMHLASGDMTLSGGEYLSADYLGEQYPLPRTGGHILRKIRDLDDSQSTFASAFYTDFHMGWIPSDLLTEPLSLNFHRTTGEIFSLDVVPPPVTTLTSPVDGAAFAEGEDFDISWDAEGSGYRVIVKMETVSERSSQFDHFMWVPVEKGSVTFSEFKQDYIDRLGPWPTGYFNENIRVSVRSLQTTVFEDSPYALAAVEFQRLPSEAMIYVAD